MCLAVPGQIIRIEGDEPLDRCGQISFDGVIKDVSFAYVPDARVGDYALVHAGFAIQLIDALEAAKVLALLNAEGTTEEEAEG